MTKMLKILKVVAIVTFLVQFVSCNGNSNKENGNSTSSIVDAAEKTSDGLIYAPNILPEGKTFKKAKPGDYSLHGSTPHKGIDLVAECFGDKDNLKDWYTGYIKDGNLMVDPKDKKYNMIAGDKYTSEFVFPAVYNAKMDTLRGMINAKTGVEVLPCKYKDVFYDEDEVALYYWTFEGTIGKTNTDGSFIIETDKEGNVIAANYSKYEPYQEGDYWGVKVDGKDKYPAKKYQFLSLARVPGKDWHFVCGSLIDGKIKYGIVSFAFEIPAIVVRRIYDDYEFLGNNGSYAANAVRFYDARHTKTSAPLVLNCNGEEAGTRVGDKFYEDLVKDWKRKHYGEKWVD